MDDQDRKIGVPPDTIVDDSVIFPMTEDLPSSAWHVTAKMKELHSRGIDGRNVIVAVNDTAGQSDHPFLPKQIAGKDFTNSRYALRDTHGHGTHVQGIVISVAPKAKLVCAKVLGDSGSGSTTGINAGRVWAAREGADVISESLGDGGGPPIQADLAAYDSAYAAGVSICCAALGNAGYNGRTTIGRPGSYSDHNHGIAALQSDWKTIAGFSSGGPQARYASPGAQIVSCKPGGGWVLMSGTCIAKGSYVYGPMGPKTIETMQPGDVVYAWKDGNMVERVVYQNHYRGVADTVVINANGRDVRVTPTHQLMCFNRRDRDFEWVEAQNISDNHRMLLPRRFANQINPYLDRMLDADFCWLLGFFAGDGWISYTTRGMRSCFATGDKKHVIERVEHIYQKATGKSLKSEKSGSWHYDDSTMVAMVIECLGFHEPAHSKNFPLWLWNLPKNKQVAFYNGYLAADGNRKRATDDTHAFECVSKDLVRRIAVLHDYWGAKHGRCRTRQRFGKAPSSKEKTWNRSYQLTTNANQQIDDGWSFLSHRKPWQQVAKGYGIDSEQFAAASVKRIDELETVDVYDLTVPDADCFVTQGLITHNSMATPWQAGLYALIIGWRRGLGYADIRGPKQWQEFFELNKLTIDLGSPGWDPRYGNGLVDVLKVFDFLLDKTSI